MRGVDLPVRWLAPSPFHHRSAYIYHCTLGVWFIPLYFGSNSIAKDEHQDSCTLWMGCPGEGYWEFKLKKKTYANSPGDIAWKEWREAMRRWRKQEIILERLVEKWLTTDECVHDWGTENHCRIRVRFLQSIEACMHGALANDEYHLRVGMQWQHSRQGLINWYSCIPASFICFAFAKVASTKSLASWFV